MKNIVALIVVVIVSTIAVPASAKTWMGPDGVRMSDTCVSPDGTYMVFENQFGPVGYGCSFYFNGIPVLHYGTFQ
jgi:hypothetical protein